MSDGFVFNPVNGIVNAAKYEAVKVLPNTPRNPEDWNAMEDILRYRQVMLVRDLFGNVRIEETAGETPFIVNGLELTTKGKWYLDGYLMDVKDVKAAFPSSAPNYPMYVYLETKFELINYSAAEDSTLTVQDPVTKRRIPTSDRVKLSYKVNIVDPGAVLSTPGLFEYTPTTGYDAGYCIGIATYAAGSWTVTPDSSTFASGNKWRIVKLAWNAKYSDLAYNVAHKVHTEDDGIAYYNGMTTKEYGNTTDPYISVKKSPATGAVTQISAGIYTAAGKQSSGFESLLKSDGWQDILWIRDSNSVLPEIQVTKNGFIHYEASNYGLFSAKRITISSTGRTNFFDVTPSYMHFQNIKDPDTKKVGFKVNQEAVSSTPTKVPVTSSGSTTGSTGYEKRFSLSSSSANTATYTINTSSDPLVSDGKLTLNHRLAISTADTGYFRVFVHAVSSPFQATYAVSVAAAGESTAPLDIYFPSSYTGNLEITYSLHKTGTLEVSGLVELATTDNGGNAIITFHDTPSTVTTVDYLNINDHIIWIDSADKLRVRKKADGELIGKTVADMVKEKNENTIFDESTFGLKTIKTSDNAEGDVSAAAIKFKAALDANITEAAFRKSTIQGEVDNTVVLALPTVDATKNSGYGVMQNTQYKEILDEIAGAGSNKVASVSVKLGGLNLASTGGSTTPIFDIPLANVDPSTPAGLISNNEYSWSKPLNSLFVSAGFVSNGANHYQTITAAITAASNGQTIFVYPGTYIENILIDKSVNIIALDPDNTFYCRPDGTTIEHTGVCCEVAGGKATISGTFRGTIRVTAGDLTINGNIRRLASDSFSEAMNLLYVDNVASNVVLNGNIFVETGATNIGYAVFNLVGKLTINNSKIECYAGKCIRNESHLTMNNCHATSSSDVFPVVGCSQPETNHTRNIFRNCSLIASGTYLYSLDNIDTINSENNIQPIFAMGLFLNKVTNKYNNNLGDYVGLVINPDIQ